MKSTMEILEQYGLADSYERTCLFLQFPDLRNVFHDIEFENHFIKKDRTIFDWIKCIRK
jgi:hypothetical protein